MATSLIDTVKDYLTPDVMQEISSLVGESRSTTQKGMESIVPAVFYDGIRDRRGPHHDGGLRGGKTDRVQSNGRR